MTASQPNPNFCNRPGGFSSGHSTISSHVGNKNVPDILNTKPSQALADKVLKLESNTANIASEFQHALVTLKNMQATIKEMHYQQERTTHSLLALEDDIADLKNQTQIQSSATQDMTIAMENLQQQKTKLDESAQVIQKANKTLRNNPYNTLICKSLLHAMGILHPTSLCDMVPLEDGLFWYQLESRKAYVKAAERSSIRHTTLFRSPEREFLFKAAYQSTNESDQDNGLHPDTDESANDGNVKGNVREKPLPMRGYCRVKIPRSMVDEAWLELHRECDKPSMILEEADILEQINLANQLNNLDEMFEEDTLRDMEDSNESDDEDFHGEVDQGDDFDYGDGDNELYDHDNRSY
ncbi:hypothetical protein SERLADRAFT_408960 [Serpula lacrymans var. lacrymans S7.9]|uniref:Uncharacterized protein n=1 Tax=Serpula lacrymans var. lacrymans (strain S7.9) TaxID=578457 RepID=F8NYI6_SERL9|nr:uncharacterized protein SERLADRAFT_408960 [Serpula lacrymans var. lacrymans S7.9]EGO23657.1 hypothetical protein SERLADRAFT_408960 [Serpula lacrymans var. lacrymans S7.9]